MNDRVLENEAEGVGRTALYPGPDAKSAPDAARIKRKYITVGGEVRTYCLYVPPGYRAGIPAPLVVNLHGIADNAEGQDRLSGMSYKADEAGFIVVYPEALGSPSDWQIGACEMGADNLVFLRDLIGRLCNRLSIDPARIYAAGMSNGGGMANRMACEMADEIAAIGVVSGAYPFYDSCWPTRPVPVVAFHGSADVIVPYGGLGRALPSIREWAAGWAVHNGCDPTPSVTYRWGRVTVESWGRPGDVAMVTLYSIAGGKHVWPGADGGELVATDIIWDFFAAHPMA